MNDIIFVEIKSSCPKDKELESLINNIFWKIQEHFIEYLPLIVDYKDYKVILIYNNLSNPNID